MPQPRKSTKKRKTPQTITVVIPAAPTVEIEALSSLQAMEKIVLVIIERGDNPSTNRNRGARAAQTEFVAFVNAHTTLAPDWAQKTIDFLARHPEVDIVGGPQLGPPGEGFFERSTGYALRSFFGSFGARARYMKMAETLEADETMLTSANLICRKKVFEKVLFDDTLYPGEDPKFIADAKKEGLVTAYSPSIVAYNRRRGSIFQFMKQIFNYGKARPRKETLKETAQRPFFFGPTLFVFYLIALPFLAGISIYFTVPLAAYAVIALVFSVVESNKAGEIAAAPLVFILFGVMHISYGAGFFSGLIDTILKK